jgi:hypothetical protein
VANAETSPIILGVAHHHYGALQAIVETARVKGI